MRTNFVRWFAVFTLACLVACGGSGGGGGDPSPPSDIDLGVVAAANAVLDNATAPDGALTDFAAEVSRIYRDTSELNAASDMVTRSWLAALQNGADFQALWQSMENAGGDVSIQALATDSCNAGGTVFYVNGILNEHVDAANARAKFLGVLHTRNPNTPACALKLFYNKSGLSNIGIQIFCHMFGLVGKYLFEWRETHARTCIDGLGFTADLSEAFAQWREQVQRKPDLSDPDIVQFRQQIRAELAKGKVIFLVGHSQGNFFIQQAIDGLSVADRQSVGVLAIASPANYPNQDSYGSFRYFTLENDAILTVPGALSATGANEWSRQGNADGFAVHSFIDSYLGFQESREAILDLFDAIGGELASDGGGGGFDETGGK